MYFLTLVPRLFIKLFRIKHKHHYIYNGTFDVGLAGNVREWTTEEYAPINSSTGKKTTTKKNNSTDTVRNRVVRGGSANLNKIANSRNGYPEDLTDEYWGFRMVLYENT